MKGPYAPKERCRCTCECRNSLYRTHDRAVGRCSACTQDHPQPRATEIMEPLHVDEMRATVLNLDWPHRWWLTVAGTSYTLLDAHKPDHRRWLARAATHLLWALGCHHVCDVAQPRNANPPAQWDRPHVMRHAGIRPATSREVEAVMTPLIGQRR